MIIRKEITDRIGNDYWANYECNICGDRKERKGYDDAYYYINVEPKLKCLNKNCSPKNKNPIIDLLLKLPRNK